MTSVKERAAYWAVGIALVFLVNLALEISLRNPRGNGSMEY
jgi:hypothetical protein